MAGFSDDVFDRRLARSSRPSPPARARRRVAVFPLIDKLPAWAGVLLGAVVAAPGAYAAERWLPAWAAYACLGAVLAGAVALAWSGKPMSEVVREEPGK